MSKIKTCNPINVVCTNHVMPHTRFDSITDLCHTISWPRPQPTLVQTGGNVRTGTCRNYWWCSTDSSFLSKENKKLYSQKIIWHWPKVANQAEHSEQHEQKRLQLQVQSTPNRQTTLQEQVKELYLLTWPFDGTVTYVPDMQLYATIWWNCNLCTDLRKVTSC